MESPVVSVVVPVYNHERYIERCLRSIAAQKCAYPFEVLVGEDCSPDNSREVLKKLEPELPDFFHIYYREHNMGDRGNGNSSDLLERCRGKYLVICEGDDFWTYEGKLQEQVAFMEGHPDYVGCFHHCEVVGEDSQPNGEKYPDCLVEEYSFKEYFYCTMPGQTATFMARVAPYEVEKKRFLSCRCYDAYPSDRRNAFILLTAGKVHVFQETWSAYRHVVAAGTSYSAKTTINETYATNEINFAKTLVAYAMQSGDAEAIETAKATYYRLLLKWSVGSVKIAKLSDSLQEVLHEPRGIHYLLGVPRWYLVLGFRSLMGRGVNL